MQQVVEILVANRNDFKYQRRNYNPDALLNPLQQKVFIET